MKRICFICLGNICRSTMAEFLFKKLIQDKNLQDEFLVESRGTSNEVEGWGVYEGTAKILDTYGIDYSAKQSTPLLKSDADKFDYFICMDNSNVTNTKKIIPTATHKISKLLDYTAEKRDVADPYYTRDFEKTRDDVLLGTKALLEYLLK